MNKNNLLASVTLFGELYNSNTFKSIPDIIAEFIKGAVISKNLYSFNSREMKSLLDTVYGFNIPESVIRTVLKSKFKDVIKVEHKIYHFDQKIKKDFENFDKNVSEINEEQNSILETLYSFIEKKKSISLDKIEKERVFKEFSSYLMDNGYSDKYSDLISAFIISNELNVQFKESLNSVKEGLILYQGINYTDNITQLGRWNTELTIYLSTEHLFNCIGFNGVLYQEIFNDFYKLILEINRNDTKKTKGKNLIELKYLSETKDEVDYFFKSAESIKKGYKKLDPSKLAMVNILKDCESTRDIKKNKLNFIQTSKNLT